MKITKDTSKQYQEKLTKQLNNILKQNNELQKFINPKFVNFKCNICNTHYQLDSDDFITQKNASILINQKYIPEQKSNKFTLIAKADCPTCQNYNITIHTKYQYHWIVRSKNYIFNSLLNFFDMLYL